MFMMLQKPVRSIVFDTSSDQSQAENEIQSVLALLFWQRHIKYRKNVS